MKVMFPAWLPDRQLRFTYYSNSRGGGVLDIVHRTGHLVPGYVFQVRPEGLAALDEKEGAPNRYRRIETVCFTAAGEEYPVMTYEVRPELRQDFVRPAPEYVNVVAAGLEAFEIDKGPLHAAERNEDGSALTPGLFVYGTLMRGECRHYLITAGRPTCILLAQVPGKLHDLHSYPGLRLGNREEATTWVEGEFLRLSRIDQALGELDRVEGFNGFGTQDSLFRRTLVHVGVGDGRVRHAWAYVYAGDTTVVPVISSGDWRIHHGRKEQHLRAIANGHRRNHTERELAQIVLDMDPWIAGNEQQAAETLLPIWRALENGSLSERKLAKLAQASSVWTAWAAV